MKTLCLLTVLLIGTPAWASTITFDEPGIQSSYYQGDNYGWTWYLPSAETGYWSGYQTLLPLAEEVWQSTYGNTSAFPSSNTAMYNLSGVNSFSLSGPPSTVEGFWIAPWLANDTWYDPYSPHMVSLMAWNYEGYVAYMDIPLTPGFQYVTTNFAAPVQQLSFSTHTQARQWVLIDDLTLSTTPEALELWLHPPVVPVPEPATWLFVSVGLLLIISTALVIAHAKARL